MDFKGQIQQWVNIDDELKKINEKAKELRDKRNMLEKNITSFALSNNIASPVIPINGGRLRIANTRVPEPLTFKYLEKTLREIIKNENQVNQIIEHIKQKREIKNVTEIKRY